MIKDGLNKTFEVEKLNMIQIDDRLREEIVHRIVEMIHPQKIILFGSRVRGDARPESDMDILVIAGSKEPRYRRAASLYEALSDVLAPMDILVYSPEEVKEWSEVRQAFVTTAVREGKIIYENQGGPGKGLDPEGRE